MKPFNFKMALNRLFTFSRLFNPIWLKIGNVRTLRLHTEFIDHRKGYFGRSNFLWKGKKYITVVAEWRKSCNVEKVQVGLYTCNRCAQILSSLFTSWESKNSAADVCAKNWQFLQTLKPSRDKKILCTASIPQFLCAQIDWRYVSKK